MPDIDIHTAYLADWQQMDFIETGDWFPDNQSIPEEDPRYRHAIEGIKLRRVDSADRRFLDLAATLGASVDDNIFTLWPPLEFDQDWEMQDGDRIVVKAGEGKTQVTENWIAKNPKRRKFGWWITAVTRAKDNVDGFA